MRKQILTIPRAIALIAALGMGFGCLPAYSQSPGLVPHIVTDPLSGIAMYGFDPVSYFTEGEPLEGKPEYEYEWEGVSWLFSSAANRDLFIRNPGAFAPKFGGYGVTALSRGYLSEGNPRIFVVAAGQLFLFYSTANREAFLLSQRGVYLKAAENWPILASRIGAEPVVEAAAPAAEPVPEAPVEQPAETAAGPASGHGGEAADEAAGGHGSEPAGAHSGGHGAAPSKPPGGH